MLKSNINLAQNVINMAFANCNHKTLRAKHSNYADSTIPAAKRFQEVEVQKYMFSRTADFTGEAI